MQQAHACILQVGTCQLGSSICKHHQSAIMAGGEGGGSAPAALPGLLFVLHSHVTQHTALAHGTQSQYTATAYNTQPLKELSDLQATCEVGLAIW